jgi:DNA-binding beta-propeller fold protein YncE
MLPGARFLRCTALVVAFLSVGARVRADFLFVSSFNNDRVYQLDAATGNVVQTFTDPGFLDGPMGLALSANGQTLYVANRGNADVHRFDVATGARTQLYASTLVSLNTGLALSSNESTLYVAGLTGDNLVAFNTTTGAASDLGIFSLNNPQGVLLAPGGASVYISQTANDRVVQRNLVGGALIRTFQAPGILDEPGGLALSGDGSTLYVSNIGASMSTNNLILRFNTATGASTGIFTVPAPEGDMLGLALSPDGSTLFVSDVFNDRIVRINTTTGSTSPLTTNAVLDDPTYVVYFQTAVVPEPGSLLLAATCAGGLFGLAWRRRRSGS